MHTPSHLNICFDSYIPTVAAQSTKRNENGSLQKIEQSTTLIQSITKPVLCAVKYIGSYFVSSSPTTLENREETLKKTESFFAEVQKRSSQQYQAYDLKELKTEPSQTTYKQALEVIQEHAKTKHQKIALFIASGIVLTTSSMASIGAIPLITSVALTILPEEQLNIVIQKLLTSNSWKTKTIGATLIYQLLNSIATPTSMITIAGTKYCLLPTINYALSKAESASVVVQNLFSKLFHNSTITDSSQPQCSSLSINSGSLFAASIFAGLATLPSTTQTAPISFSNETSVITQTPTSDEQAPASNMHLQNILIVCVTGTSLITAVCVITAAAIYLRCQRELLHDFHELSPAISTVNMLAEENTSSEQSTAPKHNSDD